MMIGSTMNLPTTKKNTSAKKVPPSSTTNTLLAFSLNLSRM